MSSGVDEVVNNIEFFLKELKKNELAAMEKACQIIENDAKRKCPVDDGILRASITHKVTQEEGGLVASGRVGTGIEYAPYVHQGTGIYAVNGDGRKTPWVYKTADGKTYRTIGQHPQPFLLDAVMEKGLEAMAAFKEVW